MLEAAINSGPVLPWLQTYCTLTWNLDSYYLIEAQTKCTPLFQTTFSNAFSWMQIYEFRWSLFARVQLTIYTSVGSDNGLVPASEKTLSFCTLCLDQSVHLRNRTVTSLDTWILQWRQSHWCLKSPVTQLDCLFNRLFRQTPTPAFLALCEGNPLVTDGFPSQKSQ